MSVALAAALAMARRGFRVFPVRPYGKKPAIEDYPAVATTDEAQIRAWLENTNYNYGVLTNDMVVVDTDVRKGDHVLDNYAKVGGHWDTLVVRTPTGGFHSYFDGPDSGLRVNFLPGLDIRSHNGYVLGPGSYTDPVLSNDPDVKAKGYYEIVVDKPVAWVPPGVEPHLRDPGARILRNDAGIDLDTEAAKATAAEWLRTAEPAVEGAGGDNHTYQTAAKLVRDYALTEETAFLLMLEHWNERCTPPWQPDDLWRKVLNAAAYGKGQLGQQLPEQIFREVQVVQTALSMPAKERGIYMGNATRMGDIQPRPWISERLALRGDVTVIAAAGAAGKSAFVLTVCAHFAVGKDFGPYRLKAKGKPLRTLIYNAEDDKMEQSRRLAAICMQYKLDFEAVAANIAMMDDSGGELLLVTNSNRSLSTNENAVQFVIATALEEQADIIVFDPMVNIHSCNENDNTEMRFVISTMRRIARTVDASVVLPHHVGKAGGRDKQKGDADLIRGAGAIVNSARIALMLSGPTDEDRRAFGIKDDERNHYTRIDDAKTNMFLKSNEAIMWLKWEGVRLPLPSGDALGVPTEVSIEAGALMQARRIAEALFVQILAMGSGGITRAEAARILAREDEVYAKMAEKSPVPLRRLLEHVLRVPVKVESGEYVALVPEKDGEVLIKIVE